MDCEQKLNLDAVLLYRALVSGILAYNIEPTLIREAVLFDAWLTVHRQRCEACSALYAAWVQSEPPIAPALDLAASREANARKLLGEQST